VNIVERNREGVTILDIQGQIRLYDGDERLRHKITGLINTGQMKVVLNLRDCTYVDAAGLAEIYRSFTAVLRSGGMLKLLSLSKQLYDTLVATKLLTVFEVYDHEDDVIASF
jgi:anti-sigma B factor antagonist